MHCIRPFRQELSRVDDVRDPGVEGGRGGGGVKGYFKKMRQCTLVHVKAKVTWDGCAYNMF